MWATTCSTAKIERVQALGPDLTIDYQIQDFSRLIQDYDVVLDTVGGENEPLSLRVLKERAGAHYVSLLMPMAVYIDEYGFLRGGFSAIRDLMSKKRACGKLGIKYDWGAFRFDAQALTAVKETDRERKDQARRRQNLSAERNRGSPRIRRVRKGVRQDRD